MTLATRAVEDRDWDQERLGTEDGANEREMGIWKRSVPAAVPKVQTQRIFKAGLFSLQGGIGAPLLPSVTWVGRWIEGEK
jgi:hypothetical protein